MDWAQGHNPFRPFERFPPLQPLPPPARTPYVPRYTIDNPSPYYTEQIAYYCKPTITDPFAPKQEVPEPQTRLQAALSLFLTYFLLAISFLSSALVTTLSWTIFLLLAIINIGIITPTESTYYFFTGKVTADAFFAAVAAFIFSLLLLPVGIRVTQEIVVEESKPLYKIFIAGGKAFGTGPVTYGQF